MNSGKPNFIPADDLYHITGLWLEDTYQLQYYTYYKGWVQAFYIDGIKVPVYVEGYFPTKHLDLQIRGQEERWHKFKANLESDHAKIGLTDAKLTELQLYDDDDISEVYFHHTCEISELTKFRLLNLYILEPDLFEHCDEQGIFDARDRYLNLVLETDSSTKSADNPPNSPEKPASSVLELHSNTSPQLLDLLEANNKFWKLFDPESAETAPTKAQVIEWFTNKGHPPTLASSMDTILRDGRRQPGGRPINS